MKVIFWSNFDCTRQGFGTANFCQTYDIIIPKGHSYYPENFRSESGLNKYKPFFGVLKLVLEPEEPVRTHLTPTFRFMTLQET